MKKNIEYGFMYRGNGYGFWKTRTEAQTKAREKEIADKSYFSYRFGTPQAKIWLCEDKKPIICKTK